MAGPKKTPNEKASAATPAAPRPRRSTTFRLPVPEANDNDDDEPIIQERPSKRRKIAVPAPSIDDDDDDDDGDYSPSNAEAEEEVDDEAVLDDDPNDAQIVLPKPRRCIVHFLHPQQEGQKLLGKSGSQARMISSIVTSHTSYGVPQSSNVPSARE